MDKIDQLTESIRQIIRYSDNSFFDVLDGAEQRMLNSCLDVIEDSNACLDAPFAPESDDLHLNDANKYMYVYGKMQALILQQDAVSHFLNATAFEYTIEPLKYIRDIRHKSVGHPTLRGGGAGRTFHFITRESICNEGFELTTAFADNRLDCSEQINLRDLIV
ncbi:MAG: hypothetical protein OXT74_00210, partial [Candidatus Poribacteria bacterium]|nr:hypothetical protein [Candidatus Poribacteria bacterium]